MHNVFLLSFSSLLKDWNEKIGEFLNKYSTQPWFWVTVVAILFVIGVWAIGYLNKK